MSGDNDLAKMRCLPKEALQSVIVAIESIVSVRLPAESQNTSMSFLERR